MTDKRKPICIRYDPKAAVLDTQAAYKQGLTILLLDGVYLENFV
jgi:hypothetical protein